MKITLKGIIQYSDGGHEHVQVMVVEDDDVPYVLHEVGVDVEVNRGKILTFLSAMYGILPDEIVWPGHIQVKDE